MLTMKNSSIQLATGAAILTLAFTGAAAAQDLDPEWQVKPPADSWPGYHGDYSGRRHSPLTQITPLNVDN